MALGLVAPTPDGYWFGGLHFLQHLVAGISMLPPEEALPLCDVWWGEAPRSDPFAEVRPLLEGQAVVSFPRTRIGRAGRWLKRLARGQTGPGMSDLFQAAGIEAVFPLPPCQAPGVPLVFWITDLQYRHHPEHYPESRLRWFEDFNERHGEAAERVVVSSEAVLDDVRRFLPAVLAKARVVRVCSVPTPTWWRADPKTVAERYGLPERFFVISNQVCVHKNHQTVVDAVRALRDRGVRVDVACTGRNEDYRDSSFFPALLDRISKEGLDSQVRFLGAVPRDEHVALLRRSLGLIQPSLFEGWGLAISDAKALGKAVLASDLPVHHEHGHPRIKYVPPADAEAWADVLEAANAQLAPGPDPIAEEDAARRTRVEAQNAGRVAVSVFREVMRGLRPGYGLTSSASGAGGS